MFTKIKDVRLDSYRCCVKTTLIFTVHLKEKWRNWINHHLIGNFTDIELASYGCSLVRKCVWVALNVPLHFPHLNISQPLAEKLLSLPEPMTLTMKSIHMMVSQPWTHMWLSRCLQLHLELPTSQEELRKPFNWTSSETSHWGGKKQQKTIVEH